MKLKLPNRTTVLALLTFLVFVGCSPSHAPQTRSSLPFERVSPPFRGTESKPGIFSPGIYRPEWKDETLRIRLADSGPPPVIVVREGFVTDIEADFRYRIIKVGDDAWRIGVVVGRPLLPNRNIRHIFVRTPEKSGKEHSRTNIILVGEDGKSLYSFFLKKADPSRPGIFNTRVFVSER